jgi:hypothetical protein
MIIVAIECRVLRRARHQDLQGSSIAAPSGRQASTGDIENTAMNSRWSRPILMIWCSAFAGMTIVMSRVNRSTFSPERNSPVPLLQITTSSQSCRCGGVAPPGAIDCRHTDSLLNPSSWPARVTWAMPGMALGKGRWLESTCMAVLLLWMPSRNDVNTVLANMVSFKRRFA